MNTLVIDAYDSFVYIIYQYLLKAGVNPTVVRNDKITQEAIEAKAPDAIVLGPGPGHPAAAHYIEIIQRFAGRIPIMGVCLGHQAIGQAYGGTVGRASHLMHGKTSLIEHDGAGCFKDQPQPLRATRYHSLIIEDEGFPAELTVTARAQDDGYIMGLRHRTLPLESVQFHPESILTEQGMRIFTNFFDRYVPDWRDRISVPGAA